MTRFRAFALALAALVGASVVVAAPAGAVGCYGDYCSGQDPMTTGCANDAITVDAVDVTGGRLELRWSPTCKTNWARFEQYPRGWYMGNIPGVLRAVQTTGYTQSYEFPVDVAGLEGTYWSPMIYSPVLLVHAEVLFWCDGTTVVDCAFDAATNGVRTADG